MGIIINASMKPANAYFVCQSSKNISIGDSAQTHTMRVWTWFEKNEPDALHMCKPTKGMTNMWDKMEVIGEAFNHYRIDKVGKRFKHTLTVTDVKARE